MNHFEKPDIASVYDEAFDIDELLHAGVGHEDGGHSGRWPWGSGKHPRQREGDFIDRYEAAKAEGKTQAEIEEEFGLGYNDIKNLISICKNDRKIALHARIVKMKDQGMSNVAIEKETGIPESTIRNMLKSDYEVKRSAARNTADILKKVCDEKGFIDVGRSTEYSLGVSSSRLKQALLLLEEDGYVTYPVAFDQVTNEGKRTKMLVLTPPGTEHKDVYNNPDKIQNIVDYTSDDGGDSFRPAFVYPASMDSKRIYIRRPDDGGSAKDGVIEIRPGVKDLDLGESHYAQVRILVDDKYYMKGMAKYGDFSNMPDNVDVIFNTHYDEETKPGLKALKKIKTNPDGTPKENPFGSLIKPGVYDPDDPSSLRDGGQSYYIDDDGQKKLSLINKKSAEGDWESWSDHLPSQFLSKQPIPLIRKQLDISKSEKQAELDDILELENPVVKRSLLMDFAETCDKNAVTLQAAALPGQKYQVLLPVEGLKDNEFYCPRYKNGEKVVLIRYPHGGTFEIPEGVINNKNPKAIAELGQVSDAIGINPKVAARLSGADFDGDTVMVIPVSKVAVKTTRSLPGLVSFDNKMEYGYSDQQIVLGERLAKYNELTKKGKSKAEIAKALDIPEDELKAKIKEARDSGVHLMRDTQKQMGVISNLITDMTLKGASEDELTRAVKHSMVVIDAEKHNLDYKRSEIENDIDGLKKKYQRHYDEEGNLVKVGGASTLISRAKSEVSIDKRQGSGIINKETGEITYKVADDLYYPDRSFDKATGTATVKIRKADGKISKVTYNYQDKQQNDIYKPIQRVDAEGNVYFTNKKGDIYITKKRADVSTAMAETKDARTLSSGKEKEDIYADYANYLKALANTARKEAVNSGHIKKNDSAAEAYKKEKEHLLDQLLVAEMNQPKERKAQTLANAELKRIKELDPDLPAKEASKISQQLLTKYRLQVGAKSTRMDISQNEWNAIQAGALTENQVSRILLKADSEQVRQYATPKNKTTLSTGKQMKISAMAASGHYTRSEIAESLGISVTTVNKYLKGE